MRGIFHLQFTGLNILGPLHNIRLGSVRHLNLLLELHVSLMFFGRVCFV